MKKNKKKKKINNDNKTESELITVTEMPLTCPRHTFFGKLKRAQFIKEKKEK